MKITIDLPDWAIADLQRQWINFDRSLLEAIVIEGYRTRALSTSDMRKLLGLDITGVQEFLAEREIPVPITPEEQKESLDVLRRR